MQGTFSFLHMYRLLVGITNCLLESPFHLILFCIVILMIIKSSFYDQIILITLYSLYSSSSPIPKPPNHFFARREKMHYALPVRQGMWDFPAMDAMPSISTKNPSFVCFRPLYLDPGHRLHILSSSGSVEHYCPFQCTRFLSFTTKEGETQQESRKL